MKHTSENGTVYEFFGSSDNPALILIHGLGLTRETWLSHIPALSEHFNVLVYDLFGHGESTAPPEVPNLKTFSEQLISIMDETGIARASIIGFSLGGMINRRLAMDHPSRVTTLGILNSPHERGEAAQKLVEERAAKSGTGGPGATIDETIKRWFTPDFIVENTSLIDNIRNWVISNDDVIYTQCRQVLASGVIELIRPTPAINKPTLVITCENDSGSTPAMSHDIAAEIANAETIIIPALQHMGLVEQPDLFTTPLIDFLQRHSEP